MTLGPKAPAGLVRMDSFSSIRPSQTADGEGNLQVAAPVLTNDRGTLSGITERDIDFAASRGTTVDAVLGLDKSLDVQTADLVTIRGLQYEVIALVDTRLIRRALLRAVI